MKKLLVCLFLGLAVLVASPLVTVTIINVGQPLASDGIFYVGPYTMRFGERTFPAMCVDVQGDAFTGATWSATVTNLGSNLISIYYPDRVQRYEQAAYLFSLITKQGADRVGLQHAAWALLDPTFKADPIAAAWIAEAQQKYGTIDPSKFVVISDAAGHKDGRFQEFLAAAPVPEPYAIHVLGGLLAIGLILIGPAKRLMAGRRVNCKCLPATLYVVATPIGNLEDITLRALRILRDEASIIACEDTRQSQKLLAHYELRKPLLSYHEHNEAARTAELIAMLLEGKSVALISDAGTPLLSDPGYRIVRAAIEHGLAVVPVPGASAMLAGLMAAGLATDSFFFAGFLPPKSNARQAKLRELAGMRSTIVVYESPHRVLESLRDIADVLGERALTVARELTKIHEEFLRGNAGSVREELERRPSIKGEFTLLIEGAPAISAPSGPAEEEVESLERQGVARMDAIKTVAKQRGLPKREVYRAVEERGSNRADRNHGSDRKRR